MGFQRGGRLFTQRWKSARVLSRCLLGRVQPRDTERTNQSDFVSCFCPSHFLHVKLCVSVMTTPLLGQLLCLHSFRQSRKRLKLFLGLLFLKNNQLKIISIPKMAYFRGANSAPFSLAIDLLLQKKKRMNFS
mgnify:CR=1 FL=1